MIDVVVVVIDVVDSERVGVYARRGVVRIWWITSVIDVVVSGRVCVYAGRGVGFDSYAGIGFVRF